MRATEFLDFLTSDKVDDSKYSHIEIRDENGKIKEKYMKLRREFLKEKRSKSGKRKKVH